MKNIIDIIKRYWVEVACGLGAVLGIVLIVLGLGTMGKVQEELNTAMRVKTSIEGLSRGQVINQRAVDQSARLIADVRANYKRIMEFVRERNFYPPLVDGVFPGDSGEDVTKAIAFRKAFGNLRQTWLDQLNAGTEPTPADIAAERDRMEAKGNTEEKTDWGGLGKPPAEPQTKAPTLSPEQGAALRIAHNRFIYATPDSFQESNVSAADGPMASGPPPTLEQMWHAQLEAWIQQTVVDAIARVNQEAADTIRKSGGAPWVGNLPIKDLRSLQISRYYIRETGEKTAAVSRAGGRPYPPMAPDDAFTGRASNQQYELLRFSIQMVVDAREIPSVLAGLCDRRFHVPLNVSYSAVEPNLALTGKIYGENPVVLITADYETVMFSDLYLPLMPQAILTELGKTRPVPPAEGA
ncbi:MAG TPA: hypothetical protein P5572_09470 [Phycisphaerae bacterium]|nr:hypothetical protein [Phycisphaerales bacterium]HRX85232.1 hypothetical protein [Phycisphaerae bacterium]